MGQPYRRKKLLRQAKHTSVLHCYCEGHCPDENVRNGTCHVKRSGSCFAAVEEIYDPETNTFDEEVTYGCLSPGEGGFMQCKGNLVPHLRGKAIKCCDSGDFCNRNLRPRYEPRATTPATPMLDEIESVPFIVLLASITVCLTLFLIIVALYYLRIRRHQECAKQPSYFEQKCPEKIPLDMNLSATLSQLHEQSSGSGSGLPMLVQRTISKQIQMVRSVGKGRYGEVWLAKWRGEKVAAKVFFTTEEQSWFRETEIYQTVLMRHDNILGFIAADIKGTGSWTQMLLITDYHENGSLYDFLQSNVLSADAFRTMAISIASGLSHLHTEIFGTRGKPSIAHRDIKTKNILVKRNGECCIADFGLAVKYLSDSLHIDVAANERCGTKRYMAPEVLNRTMNCNNFDAYKSADMYAFALVLWEMTRRCVNAKNPVEVNEHQLPYYNEVVSDPSFEEMQECVCIRGVRPHFPERFEHDLILRPIGNLIRECWHSNPAVRLTALRVKKTLIKVDVDASIKIV